LDRLFGCFSSFLFDGQSAVGIGIDCLWTAKYWRLCGRSEDEICQISCVGNEGRCEKMDVLLLAIVLFIVLVFLHFFLSL
jgi:hypothetical protein